MRAIYGALRVHGKSREVCGDLMGFRHYWALKREL
jgi:hypothetical protein